MRATFLAVLFLLACPVRAQVSDTTTLDEVTVEASRATDRLQDAAYAVVVGRPSERAGAPVFSLTGVLRGLPGIYASDRSNAALGERLSIRGMGARAAFGVRGVYVLLDGVPLTMPDGQAVLDIVEPTALARFEAVRGPSSTLWGNGSAGVIALSTHQEETAPPARVRASAGAYGLRALDAQANAPVGPHRLSVYAAHETQNGYRAHGRFARARAGATGRFLLGARTHVDASGAFLDMPYAESPGPLTRAEFDTDPRQAASRYIATDAGKKSRQAQAGLGLAHRMGLTTLRVRVWGLTRDLENPLPFAYIQVDRRAGGASAQLVREGGLFGWSVGADAGAMRDDRLNSDNVRGALGDETLLDQRETVANRALFGRIRVHAGRVGADVGLRHDHLRFEARDRLLANGDASGVRTFNAWSPGVGATLDLGAALAFVNISTSYETPTTTELTNRPDNAGGFNPSLDPQRTAGGEAGLRGQRGPVTFDVAAYRYRVRGLLLPFQTAEGGERTFYRNDGDARHAGVEGALAWDRAGRVGGRMGYTYTRARFAGGPHDSRQLPGVPSHAARAEAWALLGPLRVSADVEAASGYPADDAGAVRTDRYAVLDVHVGGRFTTGSIRIAPYVSARNLTDARYAGAVTVNAAGGRAYEPAPGRAFTAGISVEVARTGAQ